MGFLAQASHVADFDPHDAYAVLQWAVGVLGGTILALCYVIKKLWEHDRQERKLMWVAISDMNVKRAERDGKMLEASTIEHATLARCVDLLEKLYDRAIKGEP